MTLPTFNVIQRIRHTRLPPLRRRLLLTCALSAILLGFYMASLRSTDIFFDTIRRSDRPNCPIPSNAEDVCIHSSVNVSRIVSVCGSIKNTVGHCQDRIYGLTVVPDHLLETMSDHSYKMVLEVHNPDLGKDLDSFVQRKSRWAIDTMGVKGYEILTTWADKDRVALHHELDQLQNRCQRFFSGAMNPFGFASAWHNMGLGLAFSLYYNMTLLTPDTHNFFIPMTTCSVGDMERAFKDHPPETDMTQWDHSTTNFKSLDVDVMDMIKRREIIVPGYKRKGHLWWRSMLTYYAVRPNALMREKVRALPIIPTPCISMHVRHSDKASEADLIDFSIYMEKVRRFRAKSEISTVFVMTDDDRVIESTKDYPDYQFYYRDMPRSNKGWEADTKAGISREQQEINFLLDIYSAAQCQHSVVTYTSNVGRLVAEIMYAIGNRNPDVVSLDGPWRMDP